MSDMAKNVLFVLTSHDKLGNSGEKTGFWIEEFASPYYVLADAGVSITLASPMGGQPPIDPKSELPDFQTEATGRFNKDTELQHKLANTFKLGDVHFKDFDAVFYPGGHGPLWDLVKDSDSIAMIEGFIASNKPVAAVCHAPAVLLNAKTTDSQSLVANRKVTGFSNSEEAAVGLTTIVPFLLEDELVAKGGLYASADDWTPYVVEDGLLITGQNPASSEEVARRLLSRL
jgi:putative intracellular protease/amidase